MLSTQTPVPKVTLFGTQERKGKDENCRGCDGKKWGQGEKKPSGFVSLWCRLTRSRVFAVGCGGGGYSLKLCNGKAQGFDGFALYVVMDRGKAHHVITRGRRQCPRRGGLPCRAIGAQRPAWLTFA